MKKNARIATVNVIEMLEGFPEQVISFTDNDDGNKSAEETFVKMAKENGMKNDDKDSCLEDGYYVCGEDYGVFIIHSS